MLDKLYPPILDASIPAFYGQNIKIPFKHNALVSRADISGYNVIVKKVNGSVIAQKTIGISNWNNTILSIGLNLSEIKNSTWLQFQLAYLDKNGNIGYYSTSAVGRYLGPKAPTVSLSGSGINYKAIYLHPYDAAEKAYSYRFKLYQGQTLLADTGEKIHNVNEDFDEFSSVDYFTLNYLLNDSETYKLVYLMTTVNGLQLKAITKVLVNYNAQEKLFNLTPTLDRDNGIVNLNIQGEGDINATGHFIIQRTSSQDDHFQLTNIGEINLLGENISEFNQIIKDMTVAAGWEYKYYIRKLNNYNIYSNVISNDNSCYVSFDDSFLFDGERQLRIQFNPKVSSFKADIFQTKTDTIGSKYPFITRNGMVNYKEFPISGLISFLEDRDFYFMTLEEQERLGIVPPNMMREATATLGLDAEILKENPTEYQRLVNWFKRVKETDLTDININAEKEFKLLVLNFLNSKKLKLFKSATEGNYVVYTMNSSLNPNDTVGRMLHNFSCTAYEIQDVQEFYNSIAKDNILFASNIDNLPHYNKVVTYFKQDGPKVNENLLNPGEYAKTVEIRDADPLSKYTLYFYNFSNQQEEIAPQVITIGSTGSYNYFGTPDNIYIKGIYIGDRTGDQEATQSYYNNITIRNYIYIESTKFDSLSGIEDTTIFAGIMDAKESTANTAKCLLPATKIIGEKKVITKINNIRLLRAHNFSEELQEPVTISYGYWYQFYHIISQNQKKLKNNKVIYCSDRFLNIIKYLVNNSLPEAPQTVRLQIAELTLDGRVGFKLNAATGDSIMNAYLGAIYKKVIENRQTYQISPNGVLTLAKDISVDNICLWGDTGKDIILEYNADFYTEEYTLQGAE